VLKIDGLVGGFVIESFTFRPFNSNGFRS